MIEATNGWAVVENGQINVRSVSPHRLAAIVNFLCTDRSCVVGREVHPDKIEEAWDNLRQTAEVIEISITPRMSWMNDTSPLGGG